jgi:hypothetical protein
MRKKNVSTVAELYAAIKDPANDPVNGVGVTIVLAPGTYTLFDNGPETHGRLELRKNMSLIGVNGNPSAVKIDASSLPDSSFKLFFEGISAQQNTGAIRIGRGNHFIASLTVVGKSNSAAGIETDLTDAGSKDTVIRVEHVVSSGSRRGLDVRNIGPAMAGRIIVAEIEGNDFSGEPLGTQPSEAIRLVNFLGAEGGKIHAVMNGNRFHRSPIGCFVGNNRSHSGLVEVRSNLDTFDDNEAGCVIVGAVVSGTNGTTKLATTTFDAHGSDFKNNTRTFPITGPYRGGIVALGADVLDATATASDNTTLIVLRGCQVKDNQNQNFEAFGARTTGPITGATNNKVVIALKQGNAEVVPPPPDAATPPNTVTVIHS